MLKWWEIRKNKLEWEMEFNLIGVNGCEKDKQ